jgi:hypothetical protein
LGVQGVLVHNSQGPKKQKKTTDDRKLQMYTGTPYPVKSDMFSIFFSNPVNALISVIREKKISSSMDIIVIQLFV